MRNVLLDSHVALWFVDDRRKFLKDIHKHMEQADVCYLSMASVWELGIKAGSGRIKFEPELFLRTIQEDGVVLLNIEACHVEEVKNLPHLHRDPFDRMLVAQAIHENLVLLTVDKILGQYSPRHVKVFDV